MGYMLIPIFALILLAILFANAVRPNTNRPLGKRVGIVIVCLVGSSYLISDVSFHLFDYSRIRTFRQEDLKEVRIGTRALTSPEEIGTVCSSLRTTEWFESRHGGWGQELPLVFRTNSGQEYSYRIAFYKVHPGAVILHRIGGNDTYMLGDVGFNSKLPEVLLQLGISLPEGNQ